MGSGERGAGKKRTSYLLCSGLPSRIWWVATWYDNTRYILLLHVTAYVVVVHGLLGRKDWEFLGQRACISGYVGL